MRTIFKHAAFATALLLPATPMLLAQTNGGSIAPPIQPVIDRMIVLAQNNGGNIAPPSAHGQTAASPTWNTDQLLTSTVHQAWLLSGKNEATFFEMVTQLAEISAKNRNLELPESAEAGRRVGEMIKLAAKSDHDALLFAVVDSAVRKVGKPLPGTPGQ